MKLILHLPKNYISSNEWNEMKFFPLNPVSIFKFPLDPHLVTRKNIIDSRKVISSSIKD